jgi:hypothetical protein
VERDNFWYIHNIPYITELRKLQQDSSGVLEVHHDDEPNPFQGPQDSIEMMRVFVRHVMWISGFDYTTAAIAVNGRKIAAFAQTVLSFEGSILDLACVQYPSFDGFTAAFLSEFTECGHGGHVACGTRGECEPVTVVRPDGSFGYLKCTCRSVQMMRYWTEYFYPPLVLQGGLHDGTLVGKYKWDEHDNFWADYLLQRMEDLEEGYPFTQHWLHVFYNPGPPYRADGEWRHCTLLNCLRRRPLGMVSWKQDAAEGEEEL